MTVASLLPPNRSALDAALEQATALTLDPAAIATLWDPNTCPAALLPWLAWAYSVDDWDDSWSETAMRNVIADSIAIHKTKGTPSAIRRVMAAIGYGEVDIIEGRSQSVYDGTHTYNGAITYGDVFGWAYYQIKAHKLLTNAQADMVRQLLASITPARCHLWNLDFTDATLLYNGIAVYDGSYNHGAS